MYSFSYLEPVCCSMSSSNCCFLTCIQISQEVGQVVWYSHLFQNFPQFTVIHTVKVFGILNKAEIDVFFWNSLASSMIQQTLAIWSLIPLLFINLDPFLNLNLLNIWHFTVHILLKPSLENFEHSFTSVWDECNCVVVWAFFGIAFHWDDLFQSCGHCWVFKICWHIEFSTKRTKMDWNGWI